MYPRLFLRCFVPLLLVLLAAGCAEDQTDGQLGPAAVEITYPEAGSFVNKSRIRVRGTADGADEVMVNGQKADVVGGEWEVLVPFDEGPVTATATARDAETSVDFTVDTIAPHIVLDSPDRGLFVDETAPAEISFEGTATDEGSGLQVLALDGEVVEHDAQGAFAHTATLEDGYNEFVVRAVDKAGNESTKLRAALRGPLADPTAEIDDAAEVLFSPDALTTATDVIEALMTPERVTQFVQSSLADNSTIAVDAVSFDTLDVSLVANSPDATHQDGYLTVEVAVTSLAIDGTATIGGDDYPATITIDQATIDTEVNIAASDAGGLDITFGQSNLEVAEEDLHFNFDGLTEQDLSQGQRDTLRSVALSVARAAFSELLSDQLFDQLYDPGVLHREVELLGRTLEFQLYVRRVRITSEGVYINASIAIVSPRYEDVPDAPGALNLPLGQRSAPSIDGDVMFTTNRTAIDRLLHGAWRSGLLSLELAGSDFAGFELPVELNASALSLLLDDGIAQLDTADTPAGLRLRPQLPPVASLAPSDSDGASNDIGIELGELLVDLQLLPDGAQPIDIATVAVFLDIRATFEARDGKLALSLQADARADLDAEPALDLDDRKVEDLFVDLISLATEMLGDKMELTSAAELQWLTIDNPQAEVHGAQNDQVSITADLNANPSGLQ